MGPTICASETPGTMSVGPGVKPIDTRIAIRAKQVEVVRNDVASIFYFRRDSRLVAGNQTIVEDIGFRNSDSKRRRC